MKSHTYLTSLSDDERGLQALQSVLILAVSAVVLCGMRVLWSPDIDGAGGLFAHLDRKFDAIFDGAEPGIGDSSSGDSGSGDSGSGDSGSGDSGSGDSGSGGAGSGGGDADGGWDKYLNVAKDVAVEASKLYGQKIIDNAKNAAREFASEDVRLLEAFDLSVKDLNIDSTAMRQAVFEGAGVLVNAFTAADDLLQGDEKVKQLARAGKHQEAWAATWSTPAKFVADTIFASRAVDLALSRLPASAQISIKVGVPNAVEAAANTIATSLYEPVALRISDKLWDLHDRGLVPEPRIPRR